MNLVELPCGCELLGPHEPGCAMDTAETIAAEAAALAEAVGGHQLVAAVAALAEARLLRDLGPDDPDDVVEGLLDYLWECGLLGPVATAGGAA